MILDELVAHSRIRVEENKEKIPFEEIEKEAKSRPRGDFRFEKALAKDGLAIIAEVKKASPSKGIIDEDFDYLTIAQDYEAADVDAVSCLTEPKWFMGSDSIFKEIRQEVSLPMLRKDFIVDPYQIYEAKIMGADAVLIIVSLLDGDQGPLKDYLSICDDLGLTALVETHDRKEIQIALSCGARVLGVNNRNLKDFTVNVDNAKDLRHEVPSDVIFVAESGIKTPKDMASIAERGANAVLVGEALMRSKDKAKTIKAFRKAAQ